jgi:hypothetical protein
MHAREAAELVKNTQYAQTFPQQRQQPVHTSLSAWSMAACSARTKNQDRCSFKQGHLRACSRFRGSATHPESSTGEVTPPAPGVRGLWVCPTPNSSPDGMPSTSAVIKDTLGLPPRHLCQDLLLIPSAAIPLANHTSLYPALLFPFLPIFPGESPVLTFCLPPRPRALSPILWPMRPTGP